MKTDKTFSYQLDSFQLTFFTIVASLSAPLAIKQNAQVSKDRSAGSEMSSFIFVLFILSLTVTNITSSNFRLRHDSSFFPGKLVKQLC